MFGVNLFSQGQLIACIHGTFVSQGKGKWKLWADDLANCPPIPRDVPVNQIIVPTVETIRCTALMMMLSTHMKPLMLIGPTGTGKSVYTTVSSYKQFQIKNQTNNN